VHLFRIEAARIHPLPARAFIDRAVAGLALNLHREFQSPDSASPIVVEGLGLELVAAVTRGFNRRRAASGRWISDAREVLAYRFLDPPSLTGLARIIGVHPVTLSREFRRHHGCTIGGFIRAERIRFAARQLLQSESIVSDIAAAAGFYDQSHFTRVFKRRLRMTPLEYRRRHAK